MQIIEVNGIKCYAYHGCMPEEAQIGTWFITDLIVEADLTEAGLHDKLDQTIDYVFLSRVVNEQMAIRSYLIEHVCSRIVDAVLKEHPLAQKVTAKVTKLNAPIPYEVESVSVVFSKEKVES